MKASLLYGVAGTLFTWFVTAMGAALVFFLPQSLEISSERKILDGSLGFSAGVMLAASFWSLLVPAIELGEEQMPSMPYVPAMVGFTLGCLVVQASDIFLPDPEDFSFMAKKPKSDSDIGTQDKVSVRRLMLLVIAMTVHNFPEGLAVGVAFGSIPLGKTTWPQAVSLTLGIGFQNFPEGMAVSLPLRRQVGSRRHAFFWGQLSGSVEVLGGALGAYLVEASEQVLPYSLGFAAGAMIFVVVDSIIPESQSRGNKALSTWGAMIGFLLMMLLDVALG